MHSRWDTPKKYPCAHESCLSPAFTLVKADEHKFVKQGIIFTKAHNCCGKH